MTAGARVRRAVHGVNGVSSEWQTRGGLWTTDSTSKRYPKFEKIAHRILRKRRNARALARAPAGPTYFYVF